MPRSSTSGIYDFEHSRSASRTRSSAACGCRTSRSPIQRDTAATQLHRDGNPSSSMTSRRGRRNRLQVPVIAGESRRSRWSSRRSSAAARCLGRISLQNLDRTDAFSEADVRLLTTLAASLSVALENARLVAETRQRAAELSIVNEVGQAAASQLDLDQLIDLVGDQMAETFRPTSSTSLCSTRRPA